MTYVPGLPDPSDTGGLASFDELQSLGVSANLADIEVPWERKIVKRTRPAVAMGPGAERAAPGEGYAEYPELQKTKYTDAINWLYDTYANRNDEFSTVQLHIAAAGFMGKSPNYTSGTPDELTRNAWDEILQIAMASDKTPFEILDEAIERQGGLDEALAKKNLSAAGRIRPDISLTHPDDIKQMAREISRKTLGKGWGEEELNRFVASYQAQERAAGAAAQESGAIITAPPSLEASVEAEARRRNPVAAEATDWDNAAQMMMQAFKILGGGNAS
jgi:hypothetical protein